MIILCPTAGFTPMLQSQLLKPFAIQLQPFLPNSEKGLLFPQRLRQEEDLPAQLMEKRREFTTNACLQAARKG